MSAVQQDPQVETWTLTKPAVHSERGMIASQHHLASDVGAAVLADGGNAVDAAVAAGMAIGAVEPWMSGLGGCGYMLVYLRARRRAYAVHFGVRAPRGLDAGAYPLSGGGTDNDLFGWPEVTDDRNVHGPLSVAVPGFVAGHALALERFGTRDWAQSLAPAVALAREGLCADWYATVKIASEAPLLARYPESARVYLPGGLPPAGTWGGAPPRIALGHLHGTLSRLAEAGPRDFYEGAIARELLADAADAGIPLSAADLGGYRAALDEAPAVRYRGATVHHAPALTAGPTLARALALLEARLAPGAAPDAAAYAAYVLCLKQAYEERLDAMGDEAEARLPTSTTHMSVVDAEGNMVALTQTLLSVFGSKVVLPRTGILMNNGIMWFDPRPGRPNSMAPGKRPLCNMCPTLVEREDGLTAALGASGGRRIMPAVFQLLSFLVDYRMDLERACHQGRIDYSGAPPVIVDQALGAEVAERVAAELPARRSVHAVYPSLFACPNAVTRDAGGHSSGGAFITSPWAKAAAG